ncbi:MAG: hypothetical protein IIA68_02770 [Proteobacteria bacterium]|nr:hypothetical protein [Pseudomonadota bacterium]
MANSETGRPPKAEALARAETREVTAEDGELRLDRWFKRHFPALGHGRLEKLLRTGQVRVDGARVKAGHRLAPGQRIRVPPIGRAPAATKRRPPPKPSPVSDADAWALRKSVLYMDDDVLAINKPAGLAVQGGTGTRRHLDGMLDALKLGARTRPWLIVFYAVAWLLMLASGAAAGLAWPFYLGLAGVAAQLAWQVATLDIDDPAGCLIRFKSNRYAGWILLAGIVAAGALG